MTKFKKNDLVTNGKESLIHVITTIVVLLRKVLLLKHPKVCMHPKVDITPNNLTPNMAALDKFKELKDIAIKKCMQYMEEGRDKDEAIELIKPEIDNILQFVKDNQKELQQELNIENIIKRVQVNPLTSVFLYMMFNGFGFGEDPIDDL